MIVQSRELVSLMLVGPSFVYIEDKEMNATRLVEGTTRKFLCRTSSCNPPATVVWRLNGQLLSPDVPPMERAGEFGGTVVELVRTIGLDRSLRDYHGKILSCEARNLETGHVATDSTTLDITRASEHLGRSALRLNLLDDAVSIEMHGLTHDRILVAGELVVAECVLRGGHPLGQIRWYKGRSRLTRWALDRRRCSSFFRRYATSCAGCDGHSGEVRLEPSAVQRHALRSQPSVDVPRTDRTISSAHGLVHAECHV